MDFNKLFSYLVSDQHISEILYCLLSTAY